MSRVALWRQSLELFFGDRATELGDTVSFEDLCYVSGREPRLWSQPGLYEDMIESIVNLTRADGRSNVLEIGCAAGFVARGIAPRVGSYVGVDLAPAVLTVARRLGLTNAKFRRADGARLPFKAASFDAAFCYDVFTNFPGFDEVSPIIADMVRVVRPGHRVLVGSIPDAARQSEYEQRVKEVVAALDSRHGPLELRPAHTREPGSLLARLKRRLIAADPQILCYYFRREDFISLGDKLNCETTITDIHASNPYAGYRFNVIYVVTEN